MAPDAIKSVAFSDFLENLNRLLDHTWFRKNENKAGRWTSPDPYNGSMSLGDPQSFNRYAYVENNPVNFVDPSGLNASPNWLHANWVLWSAGCVELGGEGRSIIICNSSNPWNTPDPSGGEEFSGASGGNNDENLDDCLKKIGNNPPEADKQESQNYYNRLLSAQEDLKKSLSDNAFDAVDMVKWGTFGAFAGAVGGAVITRSGWGALGGAVLVSGVTVGKGINDNTREDRQSYGNYNLKLSQARRDFPKAAARADYLENMWRKIAFCHLKFGNKDKPWWQSVPNN